ncbi:FERM and PDZ domain-containing protein 1 isoform X2 [Dromiciops gliroides]|uniref:FERM and PDZ domain-containing protein 1 isoform X2 n=1 Tax=Dromiciops gliroides TaxID=33562 RepID=UPI001CC33C8B|nr:FERM and PDZ domain-containing protein 1 isoform X2 [Dromiciops gliroides]
MEDLENNLLQTRKAHRIEQMVAKWLRRSRDNSPRRRISLPDNSSGCLTQTLASVKHTVKIDRDVFLGDYGFHISQSLPLSISSVITGSTADGKLLPGDQILRMNNQSVDDLSYEQALDILRETEDSLSVTVARCTSGVPKSSFLTEEKRARLKTNPVKVHFAEEVLVNGHSQGNALLCMPNVLKVYLENGQTKAFKFEKNTTVKDIILTVKEKLSIHSIDHFALALEEQYNISKLHLLHEDEFIEQVVQRKESHDYRCLFRLCFVPKDPLDLLKEDPVAFEYLYLQSCSDVLQERFAVEMKCSSALRLAALHIQERIYACAQPQKISLKYIEKDWGIENFISPTLLRNMRGKDIKKAISFHMKRNQSLLEPRQKQLISAAQLRLNYLQILGELKTYGGKIFNATLMLQDRESYIALLVGAKYGISQIINSKLNIMSTLAEFGNISRVELMEESEKVSMVKIYLQDVKLLTLLLESNSAKDLACLIAGYYRLFVDSTASIFLCGRNKQVHRISAEEGYESRACSDSEESSEVDSSLEYVSDKHPVKFDHISPLCEEEEQEMLSEQKDESITPTEAEKSICNGVSNITDNTSEGSDSANTESRGCKTSGSSDSMDALEEDDLDACSSSRPEFFHFHTANFKESLDKNNPPPSLDGREERGQIETSGFLCLLDLNQRANAELQKTEFSNYRGDLKSSLGNELHASTVDPRLYDGSSMDYYNLCSNVSPASVLSNSSESSSSRNGPSRPVQEGSVWKAVPASVVESLLLNPSPSFEDTSSDDEFYDAADKLTPSDSLSDHSTVPTEEWSDLGCKVKKRENSEEGLTPRPHKREHSRRVGVKKYAKTLRKRRSFLQTDYTSQVTFPLAPSYSLESVDHMCYYEREPYLSFVSHSPTVSSLQDMQGEPGLLETKALGLLTSPREAKSKNHSSDLMEMEPETMETKSVIDSFVSSISAVRLRIDPENKENSSVAPLTTSSTPSSVPHHRSSDLFEQNDRSDPSEKTFQLQDGNVRVCKDQMSETQTCPSDPCNVPPGTKDNSAGSPEQQEVSQGIPGVNTKPQFEMGFRHLFENPIQETIQKCLEPLFSSGDRPRNSECVKNSEEEVPLSAITDQGGERLKQPSFGGSKEAGLSICDINQNSGILFQEEPRKDLDDTGKTSLANVRLPLEINDFSGEIAPLPKWQAFGTKTNQASLWHEQEGREAAHLVGIGQAGLPQEQELLLSEKHLGSDGFHGHLSVPIGLQTFHEGSSVPEHLDNETREKAPPSVTLLPVDFKKGQSPQNPPSYHLGDAFGQGTDCSLKKLKCPNYFSAARGDILETDKESLSIVPPSSKKPLLCFVHKSNPTVSTNHRSDRSLDFAGMKDVILPKIGMEQCSCQLAYATCFRGLDPEVDDENSDLETTLSSAPLTTPPSSGSQYSVHWRPELTRSNSCSGSETHLRNNCLWSEYYTKIVNQLKAGLCKSPDGFCQLLDRVVELQDILEQFGGNGNKHPQDRCAWYFSENRNSLCTGSQKLMSSCQHVIKIDQSPEEMQSAVQETFRNLIQLVGLCFQFTNCGRCVRTHRDVMVNLRDVVCAYYQFVQAAKLTCEKGYRDLSVKLLARQCTALTAAVFCLTQKFRASMAL